MNPNQRFAELAGICWHETKIVRMGYAECSCGTAFNYGYELINHKNKCNPDFSNANEVMKVMDNHPKGKLFFAWLMYGNSAEEIDDDGMIGRKYITTPGLLRDEAIEWMEKNK